MNAVIPRLLLEESHMTYCRVNPQTSGSEIDLKYIKMVSLERRRVVASVR